MAKNAIFEAPRDCTKDRGPFRWGRHERRALFGLVFVVAIFVIIPVIAMLSV
jgi:hypothetical protein